MSRSQASVIDNIDSNLLIKCAGLCGCAHVTNVKAKVTKQAYAREAILSRDNKLTLFSQANQVSRRVPLFLKMIVGYIRRGYQVCDRSRFSFTD